MKNIAVDGCTLNVSAAKITSPASKTVLCDGKGIYSGSIGISVTGYQSAGITDGNGIGMANLKGSAQFTFETVGVIDNPVVLEGDKVVVIVNGTSTKGQVVTPVTENVTVSIQSAGQNVVQGS